MIELLKNKKRASSNQLQGNTLAADIDFTADEEQLVNLIYRFTNKQDEWLNLLLSLSKCISLTNTLPEDHPYQDVTARALSHLTNAIKISSKLNSSAKYIDANSVLDHIPMGVGIIEQTGRIVEINQEARNIISTKTQWNIDQNHLSAKHLDLIDALTNARNTSAEFITLPIDNPCVDSAAKNSTTIIDSAKDKQSFSKETNAVLHFTLIPNQAETDNDLYYFCFPKQDKGLVDTRFLVKNYKLTETEALVVATLIEEISSKKTAHKLKLKETTIRSHLTNIYLKLNVKRKPELIRKVLIHSLIKQEHNIDPNEQALPIRINTETTHFIYLRDGRKLSYLDHQTKAKHKKVTAPETILIMHNIMGSAFEIPPGQERILNNPNIRILIPERPGYGDSTYHDNRCHEDFCKDIEELLNYLKIDSVKVLAHSVGGVYALALAEFLPQRIERISMVNAVGRLDDIRSTKPVPILVAATLKSARFAPFLLEPVLRMAVGKNIEQFYEQQLNFIRPKKEGLAADINLLKPQWYRHYAILNLKQSAKQTISTWSDEAKLCFSPWKFNVTNKKIEYQFWHGPHDDVVQIGAMKKLAKDVNTLHFYHCENETHLLFSRKFAQVVEQLITPSPKTFYINQNESNILNTLAV